jgi:hypothetical protein
MITTHPATQKTKATIAIPPIQGKCRKPGRQWIPDNGDRRVARGEYRGLTRVSIRSLGKESEADEP